MKLGHYGRIFGNEKSKKEQKNTARKIGIIKKLARKIGLPKVLEILDGKEASTKNAKPNFSKTASVTSAQAIVPSKSIAKKYSTLFPTSLLEYFPQSPATSIMTQWDTKLQYP